MAKLKYYTVSMKVEVSRQVLATSEEEACDKADTSDMIYEIKNYGFNEEVTAEVVTDRIPNEYDIIDDIGDQIVKAGSFAPMYRLREMYQEIVKINKKLEQAGKPTELIPFSIKGRRTKEFIEELTYVDPNIRKKRRNRR